MSSKNIKQILKGLCDNKKIGEITFSICFIGLLFIPILEDLSTSSSVSTKNFFGKDKMLTLVNDFRFYVLKDKVFDGLIVGENNWLIYTGEDSISDYQNTKLFIQNELEVIDSQLDDLCSELNSRNIKLIFVVPPNKNTIYPEYMPAEISRMNKESRLDQVMNLENDKEGCRFVDLRDELLDVKKENQVYLATDTHWNQFGAFEAYTQISKIIQSDFPNVKIRPFSDFRVNTTLTVGDLTSQNFGHFTLSEEIDTLTSNFDPQYIARSYQNANGIQIMTTTSSDKSLPTAIFYRDSFTNALLPFIAENFSEATYFWTYKVDLGLITEVNPDYVIFIITERYLPEIVNILP